MIETKKLYCNQHAMFTMWIVFSTLITNWKSIGVKGHQNNLQTSKIITRLDRAPGSKIPGSATAEREREREICVSLNLC